MSDRLRNALKYGLYTFIVFFLLGSLLIVTGLAGENVDFAYLAVQTISPAIAITCLFYFFILKK